MPNPAIYVSLWDDEDEIRTSCLIDLTQSPPEVTEIGTAEHNQEWNSCTRQFIELADGTEIDTFITEDGLEVVEGKEQ